VDPGQWLVVGAVCVGLLIILVMLSTRGQPEPVDHVYAYKDLRLPAQRYLEAQAKASAEYERFQRLCAKAERNAYAGTTARDADALRPVHFPGHHGRDDCGRGDHRQREEQMKIQFDVWASGKNVMLQDRAPRVYDPYRFNTNGNPAKILTVEDAEVLIKALAHAADTARNYDAKAEERKRLQAALDAARHRELQARANLDYFDRIRKDAKTKHADALERTIQAKNEREKIENDLDRLSYSQGG
jgi:hypothetical protein